MTTLKTTIRKAMPRRVWTALRLARMRYELRRYAVHSARHTYGGFPLEIMLTDTMAQGWYDRDWPELAEIALLRRHALKPGATVFDLGAHQCVVALMLSRIVGPTGRVIALEANDHNAAAAQRNRELNHAECLHVLNAAVAEKSGAVTFNRGLNGGVDDGTGEWGRVEVPAYSIDDLSQRFGPPDVLFIDIEGYEVNALSGAAKTLERRPDCFVEIHLGGKLEAFGGDAAQVASFFPRDSFDLFLAADPSGDYNFEQISGPAEIPPHRCFLIALGRREGGAARH